MAIAPLCKTCGVRHWGSCFEAMRDAAKLERRVIQESLPNVEPGSEKGRKGGRPRLEDVAETLAARRPWEAEGMSRRTWFRRQKERRARKKGAV